MSVRSRDKLLIVMLAFVLASAALPISGVMAQSSACQLLQFNPVFPGTVNPGQQVQVRTTITIACGQWRTYYTGRLDLVDRSSGQILSTSYLDIGEQVNYIAFPTNNATAPQTSGPWNLVLNLYIFEEGSMVTSWTNHAIAVAVGTNPASQPVAVTTSQANVTTVLETTSSTNSSSPTATSSSTNPSLATGGNGQTLLPYGIAAMIVVIILAAILLVRETERKT